MRRRVCGSASIRAKNLRFPCPEEAAMEIKVKPKTFQYRVGVRWSGEKRGVLAVQGKPEVEVASPPEFRGHPGVWSPEDLLVAAVNACTMTTFLSALARRGIELVSYSSEATGTLETADGRFRFTRFQLKPRIVVRRPDEAEAALAAFREAEAGCLIAASILGTVTAEPEILVRAQAG
jgi:organic hydroperoxide reductase OsmC/OhrA